MRDRTVFSYKGLEVKVSGEACDEVERLLSETVMGSEGGMQYVVRNIPEKLEAYGDRIRLVSLWRNYSLAGVIGACYREFVLNGVRNKCTFLRYLSLRQIYQTVRVFEKRPGRERKGIGGEGFKKQALKMFSQPHLLGFPGVKENERHILYAYVESRNERTKNIVQQAGYEYIRSFLTVAFSRFSPVASGSVSRAAEKDYPVIRKLLAEYYEGYSFFSDTMAFQGDNFYVLRENGRIIAGVAAVPTEYVIHNVPGVWGWIMMKILPFAPYWRRLFKPGLFKFTALDSIFHLPGRADVLATLFESVCAATGNNTALTWADDRGPLYDTLRTQVDLGALNRLLNAKPGLVYARFTDIAGDERDMFYDAPAYISGFDFS
ncbi:MAG: hypothetical protein R6W67_03075 [Bacteroidales bacterium]